MIMVVVVQGPCCLPLIFLEPKWPSSSLGFVVLPGEGSRSSDAVRSFTPPLSVTVVGSTLNPSENW